MSKILKNQTDSDKFISDVGVTVPASGQHTIDPSQYLAFASSSDVISLIGDGTLVVNNGSGDLSVSEGTDLIKGVSPKNVEVEKQPGVAHPKGMRARLVGAQNHTFTANTTSQKDWVIPTLAWNGVNKKSYFNGVEYYAKGAVLGDTVTFQVVDVDGIQYPEGSVIEEFAKDMYIFPDTVDRYTLYRAQLVPGFYIRIVYKSTGSNPVQLLCNLLRHLDETKDL